jgi:hypothetical protein
MRPEQEESVGLQYCIECASAGQTLGSLAKHAFKRLPAFGLGLIDVMIYAKM